MELHCAGKEIGWKSGSLEGIQKKVRYNDNANGNLII